MKIRTIKELDGMRINDDFLTLYKAKEEEIGIIAYVECVNEHFKTDYWFYVDYVPEGIIDLLYNDYEHFSLEEAEEEIELDGYVLK